jgi:hypothetical protein
MHGTTMKITYFNSLEGNNSVSFEIHTGNENTFCGMNVEFLTVELCDT